MTPAAHARGGRLAVAGGALLVVAAACSDIPTDPAEPFSIEFALPFPAVALGDTMRDPSGVATPLQVIVYNGAGNVIEGAAVRYLSLDPGVKLDPATGYVIGDSLPDGTLPNDVRVLVEVGDLQTVPLRFDVSLPPDSLHLTQTVTAPIRWSAIPGSSANVSDTLTARVWHLPGEDAAPVGVGSWRVRYAWSAGGAEPSSDSSELFWFSDGTGSRHTAVDTTTDQGLAIRRLRVNGTTALASIDTVRVIVTVEGWPGLVSRPDTIVIPLEPGTAGP